MKAKRIVVWFRQDLRLHDNQSLYEALQRAEEVIPVYVFDKRVFLGKTSFDFPKTGKYRTQFIIESVQDLRDSLRKFGSDLIIRVGKPEEEVFKIADESKASWVFCNRERTQEEVWVQNELEKRLWSIGQEIQYYRGKMLYYTQDLPFPVTHTPDVFTHFRKEVENFVQVRPPLPPPVSINSFTNQIEVGEIPKLSDFSHEAIERDTRSAIGIKGGETSALARLKYYLWDKDLIANYKKTRNDLIGMDSSSKLSSYLSQGCISPKTIYFEIKRYEKSRQKNKSTYWLFFELLWRDFFRLMAKKHGNKIFLKGGTKQETNTLLSNDKHLFRLWKEGRTGVPFIDANMRELNLTGFISNRGRQNVASFLVHDLHVNWQMGAEYMESLLIDYDPCSNWGNWNYLAGVGSDPRENRYSNILSQAKKYDPKGYYVKLWLPELQNVPIDKVHCPYQLSTVEQESLQLRLGADYPKAMLNTKKWN